MAHRHGTGLAQGPDPVGAGSDARSGPDGDDAPTSADRILESIPTAFFALGRDWRFTYVNAEAERLLGRARADLLGGDVWDLFPAATGTAFERHYRVAMASGEPATFDEFYPAPLDTWFEVRAWPTPEGLSVYFIDVTVRRRLQEATERIARRAALTASVTSDLSRTLDAEEAVAALARTLVPVLADWCVVTLADVDDVGRQVLRDIGWWHRDPEALPLVREYAFHRLASLTDHSYLHEALRTTDVIPIPPDATVRIQGVLRPGRAHELITELAPASAAVLPLRGRGRTMGAITLFNGRGRPELDVEELDTARDIAGRAGMALDNAYLYARQRRVAEELQRSFLTDPPVLENLEVAVRYVPASEAARVGGDWYDVFPHPGGETAVVIGDVAGHDLQAAAAMGQLRSLLRGIAVSTEPGPAHILTLVDRALGVLGQDTVATAVVMTLRPTADGSVVARWSNAGHPPPMVIGADGTVRALDARSLVLGMDTEARRGEHEIVLEPGATVVLYTDGLAERRDRGLRAGLDHLQTALSELADRGVEDLCDALLLRLLPPEPEDDIAVVVVRAPGAPPVRG